MSKRFLLLAAAGATAIAIYASQPAQAAIVGSGAAAQANSGAHHEIAPYYEEVRHRRGRHHRHRHGRWWWGFPFFYR